MRLFCTILFVIHGCSDSGFVGRQEADFPEHTPAASLEEDSEESLFDDSADQQLFSDNVEDEDPRLESGSKDDPRDDDSGDLNGDGQLSFEEIGIIKSECWFAVSGAYFGWHGSGANSYHSTFPVPSSGDRIAHGAAFDTAGGVFLNAREEPYIQGEGGKEIDTAIRLTFDSFAVAPGMSVEIRDGNGNEMFKGEGPALVLASDHNESVAFLKSRLGPKEDQMPEWMAQEFRALEYMPPKIPLHDAVWVKVSPIPGHKCDWEQRPRE